MGCNCKKQVINNLNSNDHLLVVKDILETIVDVKPFDELDDADWLLIYQGYNTIYPNASAKPSKEEVITKLRDSQQFLKIKYKR